MALLEFAQLSKSFGDFHANKNISFRVEKGQIHGLIGENGAGKSTLMKMLFGLEQASSGEIRLNGKRVHFHSPIDAKTAGIGMVHQHFMQAAQMTALEHLALEHASNTAWKNWFQPIAWSDLRQRFEKQASESQMPVPWDSRIEDLPIGYQQRIEILKLLDQGAEILIFDEPTAVLAPLEIQELLKRLLHLKIQGKTILLISHKLAEIKAVCDTVCVLRRGEMVWHGAVAEKTETELAELMVGQRFERTTIAPTTAVKKPLLQITNLTVAHPRSAKRLLNTINLSLSTHEIVGIAGVEGNGQSELVKALLDPGCLPIDEGTITLKAIARGENTPPEKTLAKYNQGVGFAMSNLEIRRLGLGLIAEDRLCHACVPSMTMNENFLLGQQRGSLVEWQALRTTSEQAAESYDVRPRNLDLAFSNLSGGNQQKVIVGREVSAQPQLLVAAHPTRGVDLLAIDRIHRKIIELRDRGAGVILISSDLDELLRLSDRIVVLSSGTIKAEFFRHDFSESRIGSAMGGLTEAQV